MKRIVLPCLSLLLTGSLFAQQKEGKVTYERSVQMQITMAARGGEPQTISQTRTNKFELNFANNQMSWKQLEDEIQADEAQTGGMMIRNLGGGQDDITFCDFSQSKKIEQRDFMDKRFLISDSIQKGNWKLTDETKTILDHLCRKATTQRIGKRMSTGMQNGKMERKEVDDTTTTIAWFTTDIPVPAGPEVQGQLPGLILELEVNGGRTIYKALDIQAKPDMAAIKEPTKGKKVTRAEFTDETKKMIDQMQQNGGMRFRMN
ncbi:MAG: GLPGLI family protein [Chitinophagaceae bacterium]